MKGDDKMPFFPEKTIVTEAVFMEAAYTKKHEVFVPGRTFHSLTFRKSGKIMLAAADEKIVSSPGSVTFIPQGIPYKTEIIESGEMYILHFKTSERMDLLPRIIEPQYPFVVSNMFSRAAMLYKRSGGGMAVMAAAYELLSEVNREAAELGEKTPPQKIRELKEYIDENICESTLRISALAEMRGVSEVFIRKEFKKYYSDSPLAYIKKRRIFNAKRLLQTGLYNVTEAGLHSGFENVSYFSAEFKRTVGVSPAEYARK